MSISTVFDLSQFTPLRVGKRGRCCTALLAAIAITSAAPLTQAAATLIAGNGEPVFQEAGFAMDVAMLYGLDHVNSQQTIINTSQAAHQLVYRFDLPPSAALVGLEVALPMAARSRSWSSTRVLPCRSPWPKTVCCRAAQRRTSLCCA